MIMRTHAGMQWQLSIHHIGHGSLFYALTAHHESGDIVRSLYDLDKYSGAVLWFFIAGGVGSNTAVYGGSS